MLKRLVSQGNKLKDEPIAALAMCHGHAGGDEMIVMHHIAEEMIRALIAT